MNKENNHSDLLNMDTNENKPIIKLVLDLLNKPDTVSSETLEALLEDPDFNKLYVTIQDIRKMTIALNKGDLQSFVYNKGYVLANLKALQANLRHLTWQAQMIAEGDFSQRVDFLGDFSDSFNKMTENLQANSEHLYHLANIDALTQIPNRLALNDFLPTAFESCKSCNDELCILIIDIDCFKQVNDTYGHHAGDVALIMLSNEINQEFRADDVFARYGGEEFMAVLPSTALENAIHIGERILDKVKNTPIQISEELSLSLTVSVGVSCIQDNDENYESIVRRSDLALYEAKNSGRNCLRTM